MHGTNLNLHPLILQAYVPCNTKRLQHLTILIAYSFLILAWRNCVQAGVASQWTRQIQLTHVNITNRCMEMEKVNGVCVNFKYWQLVLMMDNSISEKFLSVLIASPRSKGRVVASCSVDFGSRSKKLNRRKKETPKHWGWRLWTYKLAACFGD